MHRRITVVLFAFFLLGLAFVLWSIWESGVFESTSSSDTERQFQPRSIEQGNDDLAARIAQGKYLTSVGDCIACHTSPGGKPLAGGLAMATPYGTLYSPNITPDKEFGIGTWSETDFWRAMHNGIAPGRQLLYPVFPYVNFTNVTRKDIDDIYAYLRSVESVATPNKPNHMDFPFNERATLVFWRALFFRPHAFAANPEKSEEWNRGAYLVKGLGHCSMCHTSINLFGATTRSAGFAGGLIPAEHWYAPALNASKELGLGSWSDDDVIQLLKTGVSRHGSVYGPMSIVIRDSLQYLSDADLHAIATYLRAQPIRTSPTDRIEVPVSTKQAAVLFADGQKIYAQHCAVCHQANGEGVGLTFPPLSNNPSIAAQPGTNATRMVLLGGIQPKTGGNPHPASMPSFSKTLNNHEIAAVVTYIRHAWGNEASAVAPQDVQRLRGLPPT